MFDCESGVAEDCEESVPFDGRKIDGREVCWPCYKILLEQRTARGDEPYGVTD